MRDIQDSFVEYWRTAVLHKIPDITASLVESLIVIIVLLYVGHRLQRSWRQGRLAKAINVNFGILIGRLTWLAAIVVAILWVSYIVGFQWTGLLTFVGAIGVAVAFAVQDVLKNLVAGMYLLLERPFVIGDAITIKDFSGTVEDVQMRVTILRTATGQQVLVPNAVLFSEVVVNRREEVSAPQADARVDDRADASQLGNPSEGRP